MRTKNKAQNPKERVKNFLEVESAYTDEEAKKEAERCLQCKMKFCISGCPVNIDIPEFIKHIKERNPDGAISEIRKNSALPAVCGRVCPQENQCEKACILAKKGEPIAIGKLERYAADKGEVSKDKLKQDFFLEKNKKIKIAAIGSGPASITFAGELGLRGYDVTIFEALHKPGGVLVYGIPEFRLPKKIVDEEVKELENLGVDIKCNYVIGRIHSLKDLEERYDYIFLGTGAGLPRFMNVPGEDALGVMSANEFLTRINLMKAYDQENYDTPIKKSKKTVVIGGGNVAMDAARCAVRLGAEVTIIYRRTKEEMPARIEEIEHGEEEGIKFKFLSSPLKMISNEDGFVKSIEIQKMELGKPDESGRRRPVPIDEIQEIGCDQVIIAIGNGPNPLLIENSGLKLTKWGKVETDEENRTSNPKIFAGGDIIEGEATVIKAMGDGKVAARAIEKEVQSKI